jgi:hypothetical protein
MPGHSPLDVITAAISSLQDALRTLTPQEAAVMRTSAAGHITTAGQSLYNTISLLRDLYDNPATHTDSVSDQRVGGVEPSPMMPPLERVVPQPTAALPIASSEPPVDAPTDNHSSEDTPMPPVATEDMPRSVRWTDPGTHDDSSTSTTAPTTGPAPQSSNGR